MFGLSSSMIEYIAVAVVVALYTAFIYHEGGATPRAKLAQVEAGIASAKKTHDAEDKAKAAQSDTLITNLEVKHGQDLVAVATGWKSFHDSELLRLNGGGAGKGSQPAPTHTNLTGNTDKDNRLSDAIEGYRIAARGSLAACEGAARQSGISFGQQLEAAQRESATLSECTAFVAGIRAINDQATGVASPYMGPVPVPPVPMPAPAVPASQ